jgi:hypothetical protein
MKTFNYILLMSLFLSFSNMANAIPVPTTTWTDSIDSGQFVLAGSSFIFDLASETQVTPVPYSPGIDSIYSATRNINRLGLGIGNILIENNQTQRYSFMIYADLNIPLADTVVNDLSTTGLLQVEIVNNAHWPVGCQRLNSLTLTACGYDNSSVPVPEAGTILLLGSGLIGLVIFGRRRMKG